VRGKGRVQPAAGHALGRAAEACWPAQPADSSPIVATTRVARNQVDLFRGSARRVGAESATAIDVIPERECAACLSGRLFAVRKRGSSAQKPGVDSLPGRCQPDLQIHAHEFEMLLSA